MRPLPTALVALTCGGLLAGCADRGAPPAAEPVVAGPGRPVIVGGGLAADNAEVYRAVVEAREGTGPLCVLPTASGEPAGSMESASATLASYAGPGAVAGILLSLEDPSRADSTSVADSIASSAGAAMMSGVMIASGASLEALVVDGDTALVVGASEVVVVDGRGVERHSPTRGTGLRVTLAGTGDVVDLRTFEVRQGPGKIALPPSEAALARPDDPFAR